MGEKHGVLETSPKGRFLTFLGPGGYEITWAPGAIRIPLEVTPSGHLAFTLDNFGTLQTTKGGIIKEEVILHNSEKVKTSEHDQPADRGTIAKPKHVHWQ